MNNNLPQFIELNEFITLSKKTEEIRNLVVKIQDGEDLTPVSNPHLFYNVTFDTDSTGVSRNYYAFMLNIFYPHYDIILNFEEKDLNKLAIDFAKSFYSVFIKYIPRSFFRDGGTIDSFCNILVELYSDFGIFFGPLLDNVSLDLTDSGLPLNGKVLFRTDYFYFNRSNLNVKFDGYSKFRKLHSSLDSIDFLLLKESDRKTGSIDPKFYPIVKDSFEHKFINYILEHIPLDVTYRTKESHNAEEIINKLLQGLPVEGKSAHAPIQYFPGIRSAILGTSGRTQSFNKLYTESPLIEKRKDESGNVIPLDSSYFLSEGQESINVLLRSGSLGYLCHNLSEIFKFDQIVITTSKSYASYLEILSQDPKIHLTEYAAVKDFNQLPFINAEAKLKFSLNLLLELGATYVQLPHYTTKQLISFLRFVEESSSSFTSDFEKIAVSHVIESLLPFENDPKVYTCHRISHDSWPSRHFWMNYQDEFFQPSLNHRRRVTPGLNTVYMNTLRNFNWEQHA